MEGRKGYSWQMRVTYPNAPKATYYKLEHGEIVECPNLPADARSIKRYLARGLVLDKEQLIPQAKEGNFVCEACGRNFKSKIALIGHSRTHQKSVGG